jgi:hypothetical protein
MTLIDRRSCPFVGAGVNCGQKSERREVKLIIVMGGFTIDVSARALERPVALIALVPMIYIDSFHSPCQNQRNIRT